MVSRSATQNGTRASKGRNRSDSVAPVERRISPKARDTECSKPLTLEPGALDPRKCIDMFIDVREERNWLLKQCVLLQISSWLSVYKSCAYN